VLIFGDAVNFKSGFLGAAKNHVLLQNRVNGIDNFAEKVCLLSSAGIEIRNHGISCVREKQNGASGSLICL
jgi:hypothetical protein